jgi:predicted ATPase/DNA-binding SARP family transcriptional activator
MLRVLGEVDLTTEEGAKPIGSRLQRVLLAALALDRGQVVSNGKLADRVWGTDLPANPVASLQSHVSRLRRSLPDEIEITTVGDGYRLDVTDDGLDAVVFELSFRRACGSESPDRVPVIELALDLWRGTPYSDLDDPAATSEATRLDEMRQSLIELRAESLLESGRTHEAIADLENLRGQYPIRERPVELLMRAYVELGRKTDSLRVYQELRTRLGEELGLEPAPELRALEEAILTEDVVAERPRSRPSGLPRAPAIALPASPFHGREVELAAVVGLLTDHRIVTIVGPGGVGKTRLAVHAAHEAGSRYPAGTWLIELASVRDAGQIPEVVATALGVIHQTDMDLLDRIVDHIGERRTLLVLDNCEHLVDEAARFVAALASGTPSVTVLATGREALNIDGERLYRLDPLTVEADDGDTAAVRLFADRAAAVHPGFELDQTNRPVVERICRGLDGLPLAIELAAARLATLSLDEVVAGLEERFDVFNRGRRTADERQRSLRASVEWSCQQLDEDQLDMFARLSVFAGRFTATAAEEVCGSPGGGSTAGDVLADLVERSLLVERREAGAATRYGFLETIRVYAAELLAAYEDPAPIRDHHAEWAVAMAESTDEVLVGPDEIEAARRLTANLPELRLAHGHMMEAGDADGVLRLGAALRDFAILRMQSEMHGWAMAAADRFGSEDHPLTEAVLASASSGAWQAGDHEASDGYARASQRAAAGRREPGAGWAAAEAMGDNHLWFGDPDAALVSFRDAVRLSREGGRRWSELSNLANAVMCAGYIGDTDLAEELAAEARAVSRGRIGPTMEAWIDYAEGEALAETQPDRALDLLTRALELAELSGARFITGVAGLTHVSLLARRGDPAAPARILELIEHWREAGVWTQQWITMRTVVDVLVQGDDAEGAAVLLGALTTSEWGAEIFGADAERLAKARAAVETALGGRVADLISNGEMLTDVEAVHHAVERLERMVTVG